MKLLGKWLNRYCVKLLGNGKNRKVHRILESIAKNDPSIVNVVLNGFVVNETKLTMLAMSLVGNEHVRSLYLHNVGINANGAILLASALRYNKTLEHLSLNDNNIGPEGCAAIAAALYENRTLLTLGLSNNAITSRGAKQLLRMLKECHDQTSVTRIFLDGNGVSKKVLSKIDRYCCKARARNCPSSKKSDASITLYDLYSFRYDSKKSNASTSPCSDVASLTAPRDHRNTVDSNRADLNESQYDWVNDVDVDVASHTSSQHDNHTVDSNQEDFDESKYDLFKDVIRCEDMNSLYTSLDASNFAHMEGMHNENELEDEHGLEYFASDTDLGPTIFLTSNELEVSELAMSFFFTSDDNKHDGEISPDDKQDDKEDHKQDDEQDDELATSLFSTSDDNNDDGEISPDDKQEDKQDGKQDDKQDGKQNDKEGKKKTKHAGYFKSMKWLANRKVHVHN